LKRLDELRALADNSSTAQPLTSPLTANEVALQGQHQPPLQRADPHFVGDRAPKMDKPRKSAAAKRGAGGKTKTRASPRVSPGADDSDADLSPLERAFQAHVTGMNSAAKFAAEHGGEMGRDYASRYVPPARFEDLKQTDRRKVLDAAGMENVSAAGAPLEPLRGGGRMPPEPKTWAPRPTEPIKWRIWLNAAETRLWECVALVVGLEPTSLREHPEAWMAGPNSGKVFDSKSFPGQESKKAFDEAMFLAVRSAMDDGPIGLTAASMSGPSKETARVSLREVVAFFIHIGWPGMPAELAAIGSAGRVPRAVPRSRSNAESSEPARETALDHEPAEQRCMRRLDRLRQLGGDMCMGSNGWVTCKNKRRGALAALVREEKAAHRQYSDDKDVRLDLRTAAGREHAEAPPPAAAWHPK